MRIVAPIVLLVLVATCVALIVWRVRVRREARWEAVKQNPVYEVRETTLGARTDVGWAYVARYGARLEVYREHAMGHVDITDPDWQLELQLLRDRARERVAVLNEGRPKTE